MTSDCPKEWFKWLTIVELWYNTNYHTTIRMTPFEALYGYPSPVHVPYIAQDRVPAAVNQHLLQKESIVQLLRFHMDRAQHRMKQLANKHRSDREFVVGDWVYVKLQPYKQIIMAHRVSQKLAPIFYGSFKITNKIGSVAYKLELPKDSTIHPTFHVSKLRRSVKDLTRVAKHLLNWGKSADKVPLAIL